MRSVRPSLSIVLFVGSAAAFACGGGDDDDGNTPLQSSDAAVVATGGAGATAGAGSFDAGLAPNTGTFGGLGAFDASGIGDFLRDSGILGTGADGGTTFNPNAVCSTIPALCPDGSFSIPRGDGGALIGGLTGGGGATGGFIGGLAGGAAGGGFIGGLTGVTGGGTGVTGGGTGVTGGGATGGINIGQICQTNPQICAMFGGGGAAGTAP